MRSRGVLLDHWVNGKRETVVSCRCDTRAVKSTFEANHHSCSCDSHQLTRYFLCSLSQVFGLLTWPWPSSSRRTLPRWSEGSSTASRTPWTTSWTCCTSSWSSWRPTPKLSVCLSSSPSPSSPWVTWCTSGSPSGASGLGCSFAVRPSRKRTPTLPHFRPCKPFRGTLIPATTTCITLKRCVIVLTTLAQPVYLLILIVSTVHLRGAAVRTQREKKPNAITLQFPLPCCMWPVYIQLS